MQFNITLNNKQSQHMAALLRGEDPQEPVTSTEMSQFFAACVRSALSLTPGDHDDVADHVVKDLNRGGWSMVGQPESTHEAEAPS